MQLAMLQTAFEPHGQDKPLPQLPLPASPTLTNPDMVLPSSGVFSISTLPQRPGRPPSPSYLRDDAESPRSSPRIVMGKKEKLGLMSRKMMLLRSRTNSGAYAQHGASLSQTSQEYGAALPSSPTLQDVGNLAPEQSGHDHLRPPPDRRPSGSGSSSSDLSALNGFLAKYTQAGAASDDDAYDTETSNSRKEDTIGIANDLERQRRIQEEEEYNSAILSKRAEQILANAKKRLNVMEGNLRGARDLVAPLTAANLKRATSLGSAHHSAFGQHLGPFGQDSEYQNGPRRRLFAQASSPTMNRDFAGHARGYSETEVPERPYTSLDNTTLMTSRSSRAPIRVAEPSWIQGLRGTRSVELLGNGGGGFSPGPGRSIHASGSPDSYPLEPLHEADEPKRARPNGNSYVDDGAELSTGLGIYERPPSRTSDLREQMSSLRGKISTLKERAREESMRRQSASQSNNTSPFNNALVSAPEFFYTSASTYGSPVLETNAGVGYTTNEESPGAPRSPPGVMENGPTAPVSRNAFAEQAARHPGVQSGGIGKASELRTRSSQDQVRGSQGTEAAPHRRTASGTTIVSSARARYSHHQSQGSKSSQDMPGAFVDDDALLQIPDPDSGSETPNGSPYASDTERKANLGNGVPVNDDASVYEDAEEDAEADQGAVVAHEDREDAFDYEHFFLHSSMGSYGNGRRNSESSDTSVSSGETARGPRHAGADPEADDEYDEYEDSGDTDEDFDPGSGMWPSPTPKTPERLKEIEHELHRRAYSSESFSTLNSFATAHEGPASPMESSPTAGPPTSRTPNSRPGTAIKRPTLLRRDSSSERADSGVGLGRRSTGSDGKRATSGPLTPKLGGDTNHNGGVRTPPTSPRAVLDPVAVAVNALVDPQGRALGLRNKVVLFSLVESLRKVVHTLQEQDDVQYESRLLRRRLDEARNALEGRTDR